MKQLMINGVLSYLRWFARVKVARQNPWIIGVTGSIGKSSFVFLLSRVLESVYTVKTTVKGNSETGLPLEILGLRDTLSDYSPGSWIRILFGVPFAAWKKDPWNCLIAEMGIDSPNPPKNMEHLLSIIHPDIGVFLSVSAVHTEQFSEHLAGKDHSDEERILNLIAEEKGKIVTRLLPSQTAICNGDDGHIMSVIPSVRARVILFGKHKKSQVRLLAYEADIHTGTRFVFEAEGRQYPVTLSQVVFEEYGQVLAAVLVTARCMHVPYEKAISIIQTSFMLPAGRFSVFSGKNGSTLLDSSYNSSPDAAASALAFLARETKGKRIAVLGDMRELGPLTEKKHRELARLAAKSADSIILVGRSMKQYALDELTSIRFPKENLYWFSHSRGVGDFLVSNVIHKGDTVLIKGSQNTIFLEEAVKEMLADEEDVGKLCRQSAYWDSVRTRFFGEKGKNLV